MNFYISRTSMSKTEKPCEEAFPVEVQVICNNVVMTSERWWGIEIANLQELLELSKRLGEDLVITNTFSPKYYDRDKERCTPQPSGAIEIYDDFRE